jgi:ComF family protein
MMTMEWQSKIQALHKKILFSLAQCDLCGSKLSDTITPYQRLICTSCFTDLPLFKPVIIQGDLLNWPAINKALPNVIFDHLVCLSPYLHPFTQWLPQLKYQGRFELATSFANLLAQHWRQQFLLNLTSPVDLILSVPLHINKWKIRGYNQAHLLAKPFAQHMQVPYDARALIRTQYNASQVGKTGKERRRTLANAFTLVKALPSNTKHVVLVDDVLTTGSTANEITKILKHVGVNEVTITTVCLTLPTTNK